MVEDVGEGSFGTELEALRDGEGLADAGREVDGTGTNDRADLRVAEATDGKRRRAGAAARGARGSGLPVGIAGAGEGSGVDEVRAGAVCRG